MCKARRNWIGWLVIGFWFIGSGFGLAASKGTKAENLALGKPYRLNPKPNYRYCTDPGDRVQLTDGKTTRAYFWTQKGTVGWTRVPFATVTVDLGQIEPIGGVALTTAAGTAGVRWPLAVKILVSEDGRKFYEVGDLVRLDQEVHGPWPEGYAIRKLETHALATRGRYVQFVLVPQPGAGFLFTDEVEVYRGPESLLRESISLGRPMTAEQAAAAARIEFCVARRQKTDAQAMEALIRRVSMPGTKRSLLLEKVNRWKEAKAVPSIQRLDQFAAVLPFSSQYRTLFTEIQREVWQQAGVKKWKVWVPCPWDPVPYIGLPPKKGATQMEVHVLRGEYRAAAVNIAVAEPGIRKVRFWFEGLPGGMTPSYVKAYRVVWTDTSVGQPVAAALLPMPADSKGWGTMVIPGLVQQIWLTFHVTHLSPGEYRGKLVIEGDGGLGRKEVLVRLVVWPWQFPKKTTLLLGGWSYTDGPGSYGVTKQNRKEFVQHLRNHFVNAPWAQGTVLRTFTVETNGTIRLDTRRLDDWLAQWPDAKMYMIFLAIQGSRDWMLKQFGNVSMGTPEFDRWVGRWIRAWVEHLRSKGIAPSQLGLLLIDEPREGVDVEPIIAWARAIHRAVPEIVIWEDPIYRDPAHAPKALWEVCDVLCPNRVSWLRANKAYREVFLEQQRKGRTLHFYSCSGPAKVLDPYSYYRLQAWHCRLIGAKGTFFWAFGDNGGASSWNEYLARHGPYTPLFLSPKTVVPGKHMEAIRESVEDYEYFVMLEKALARARAQGKNGPAVQEAERLLREGPRQVMEAPGADRILWRDPKDRTVADRVRVQILQCLGRLQ